MILDWWAVLLSISSIPSLWLRLKSIDGKTTLTIIDLIGMEDQKDARLSEAYIYKNIHENLRYIRSFYEKLAGGKTFLVRDGLKNILDAPMTKAAHLLLFTAKLDHEKTFDTLEYVFIVK